MPNEYEAHMNCSDAATNENTGMFLRPVFSDRLFYDAQIG